MTIKRKQHSAQFKFRVALEAAKGDKTRSQLASNYSIHPGQVSEWKKRLVTDGNQLFGRKRAKQANQQIEQEAQLYEQIGRLKMELEWLKKKSAQFN